MARFFGTAEAVPFRFRGSPEGRGCQKKTKFVRGTSGIGVLRLRRVAPSPQNDGLWGGWRGLCRAFSPCGMGWMDLGLRPRLLWGAPLALVRIAAGGCPGVIGGCTSQVSEARPGAPERRRAFPAGMTSKRKRCRSARGLACALGGWVIGSWSRRRRRSRRGGCLPSFRRCRRSGRGGRARWRWRGRCRPWRCRRAW